MVGETTSRAPAVEFKGVSKLFDPQAAPAVSEVSFVLPQGDVLVLVGSSGSGKSTILRMVNQLIPQTSGQVLVSGEDVQQQPLDNLRRRIGYVPQANTLFPFMTVLENVALPLRVQNIPKAERNQKALAALESANLSSDLADRLPTQLSGGQSQRVSVARAIVTDAELLLMDEPFSALDAITRESLQQEVLTLQRERQLSIIFVTHDFFEALALADQIGVVHEGKLEQMATPSVISKSPATPYVRDLVERHRRKLERMGG